MKKNLWVLALAVLCIGCSSVMTGSNRPAKSKIIPDSLFNFFRLCESDLEAATGVIVEKDLTKNLTHLQRMNSGGDRYYLLEREGITGMIKAVTKGLYDDFILVNKYGTIVYTMSSHQLFSKNIRTTLKDSALYPSFVNTVTGMFIGEISRFPRSVDDAMLFVSFPVVNKGALQGIFIMAVNIEKLQNLISERQCIVDMKGNIAVSRDRNALLKPYAHFDTMDRKNMREDAIQFFISAGKKYRYSPFTYKNLRWIVVDPE